MLQLPSPCATFARRETPGWEVEDTGICTTLEEFGPVELVAIGEHRSHEAQVWRVLMHRHHYLGEKSLCGAQLRYLIRNERYGRLGGLAFSSASWALHDRDAYIGWNEPARRENLRRVVSNPRFLVVPGVRIPNLASHVLGRVSTPLSTDCQACYAVALVLLKAFIDPMHFDGACYRAANGLRVGSCCIKDRQLGSAERLEACLGVDMVVAWRIYHLTMRGREMPEDPCTAFLEEVEWKALYCYHHKTPIAPDEPPSMAEAVRMLGAMGGHLGRGRDGPPGTQVRWRGLQRLDTAVQMYVLLTQSPVPSSWRSYPDGYFPPPNAP